VKVTARLSGQYANIAVVLQNLPHYSARGYSVPPGEFVFTLINGVGEGEVLSRSGSIGPVLTGVAAGDPYSRSILHPGRGQRLAASEHVRRGALAEARVRGVRA